MYEFSYIKIQVKVDKVGSVGKNKKDDYFLKWFHFFKNSKHVMYLVLCSKNIYQNGSKMECKYVSPNAHVIKINRDYLNFFQSLSSIPIKRPQNLMKVYFQSKNRNLQKCQMCYSAKNKTIPSRKAMLQDVSHALGCI